MKVCTAKFHGEVRSDAGMKKAPVLRPGLLHGPKSIGQGATPCRGPRENLQSKVSWGEGGMTQRYEKSPVFRPGFLNGAESIPTWSWWTDSNPRPADYKLHILAFALLGAVQYIAVQSHSSCAVIPCCAALLCRIVDQKLTIANKNPGGHTYSRRGILSYFCI